MLLVERLGSDISAVQVNIELLTIDKRSFTTDEGHSLLTLFGENSEGSAQYRAPLAGSCTSTLSAAYQHLHLALLHAAVTPLCLVCPL